MNEREIIEQLAGMGGAGAPDLICGIGDDCAVIRKDGRQSWLVTMDTLVESVHFDLGWHPPSLLGRKSVAVNVSDIAAMGGVPLYVFLSLGLPAEYRQEWLEEFSRGIVDACATYGAVLAGGDTVRTRVGIQITLTVIGVAPTDKIVFRDGAQPGDDVWVSGHLGSAAAGLELCRSGRSNEAEYRDLVDAHLNPQPRVRLGMQLAEKHLVHSMMDLSDGLATDLAHLCRRSGLGALIDPDNLPYSPGLAAAAELIQQEPTALMVSGGEDYELIFTTDPAQTGAIELLADELDILVTRVGMIDEKKGVRVVETDSEGNPAEVDISFRGYDHFGESVSFKATI